jgi:hypothetical protein
LHVVVTKRHEIGRPLGTPEQSELEMCFKTQHRDVEHEGSKQRSDRSRRSNAVSTQAQGLWEDPALTKASDLPSASARREERARRLEQQDGAIEWTEKFVYRPLLPKPPSPLVASGNSSTTLKFTDGTGTMTNWAIRSPGCTTYSYSGSRFTNATRTSPR